MRTGSPAVVLTALALSLVALGAAPAATLAARLVGGRREAAISRAFQADRAHRNQVIVSIRSSSIAPSWAMVRSVTATARGRSPGGALPLHSAFYVRRGAAERAGVPPAAARADLQRPLRLLVSYSGAGSESIDYGQSYRSDCQGDGNFTDDETERVDPMSWTVRYVVDLDDVLAAAGGPDGEAIVPQVTFDAGASHLQAVESLTRTVLDSGCNGSPTTFRCTTTFHLGGVDPAGQLSLLPGAGLQIGLPMAPAPSGACDPIDYTLGPSLWDGGGATALVSRLTLVGGNLPANPYAPVSVSWPDDAAQQIAGTAATPCQGDGAVCSDVMRWRGTVRLEALS